MMRRSAWREGELVRQQTRGLLVSPKQREGGRLDKPITRTLTPCKTGRVKFTTSTAPRPPLADLVSKLSGFHFSINTVRFKPSAGLFQPFKTGLPFP